MTVDGKQFLKAAHLAYRSGYDEITAYCEVSGIVFLFRAVIRRFAADVGGYLYLHILVVQVSKWELGGSGSRTACPGNILVTIIILLKLISAAVNIFFLVIAENALRYNTLN